MDDAADKAAELARGRAEPMAIFLDENSQIIVQGMTGSEGTKHTRRMLASGAAVVGGVNARKAGTKVDFDGTVLPVFGTVAEAMAETGADVTVGFVPPRVHEGLGDRGDRRRRSRSPSSSPRASRCTTPPLLGLRAGPARRGSSGRTAPA